MIKEKIEITGNIIFDSIANMELCTDVYSELLENDVFFKCNNMRITIFKDRLKSIYIRRLSELILEKINSISYENTELNEFIIIMSFSPFKYKLLNKEKMFLSEIELCSIYDNVIDYIRTHSSEFKK